MFLLYLAERVFIIAGNAGGHRDGMVKECIQYENPKNCHYMKVDRDKGKIIDGQVYTWSI